MQQNPKSNIVLVNESNHISGSCFSIKYISFEDHFYNFLVLFLIILIFHLEQNESKMNISDNHLFILFQI